MATSKQKAAEQLTDQDVTTSKDASTGRGLFRAPRRVIIWAFVALGGVLAIGFLFNTRCLVRLEAATHGKPISSWADGLFHFFYGTACESRFVLNGTQTQPTLGQKIGYQTL